MEGYGTKNSASSSRSLISRPKTNLPPEILELIAKSGKSASAYLRFRATCKALFSNLTPNPRHLPLQPPFLMMPPTAGGIRGRFFNLATFFTHILPEVSISTRGKICYGSSFGWLVLVDYNFNASLLNPFTGAEIHLPSLAKVRVRVNARPLEVTFPPFLELYIFQLDSKNEEEIVDMIIQQAALSSDPAHDPHAVVLVFMKSYTSYRCYYFQLGDASWNWIEIPGSPIIYVYDLIPFPEKQFYAVVCDDRLVAFDFRSLPVRVTVTKIRGMPRCVPAYLVASAGELLLINQVLKLFDLSDRIMNLFDVYKFNLQDLLDDAQGCVQVDEVHSIGDMVVFLGRGHSFSISAQDFPPFRGNCIYFADSYKKQAGKEHVRVDCIELFSLEEYNTEDIFVFSEVEKYEKRRITAKLPWLVSPNIGKGGA